MSGVWVYSYSGEVYRFLDELTQELSYNRKNSNSDVTRCNTTAISFSFSMYVCMHSFMYVCMYVCIHVYVYMYVYVCVYVCMCVWNAVGTYSGITDIFKYLKISPILLQISAILLQISLNIYSILKYLRISLNI